MPQYLLIYNLIVNIFLDAVRPGIKILIHFSINRIPPNSNIPHVDDKTFRCYITKNKLKQVKISLYLHDKKFYLIILTNKTSYTRVFIYFEYENQLLTKCSQHWQRNFKSHV